MIRSAIKSTTLSLAVEGIARVMLSTVKNNPGKRAYQLGLIAFGSGPNDIDCPDHKNMLTWSALCELEKRHANVMAELPKLRHAVFYALSN